MRLLVTRPIEDAGPLRDRLEALGHAVEILPLMQVVPRHGVAVPGRPYQAVAMTSANAVRALGRAGNLARLPALTVGPQSLAAAKAAGFLHVSAHGGDVAGLAAHMQRSLDPSRGPILYLSGAETAGDLEGTLRHLGFDVDRLILYDAVPETSLGSADTALRQRRLDGVLLYSPRSARIWTALVDAHGLAAEAVRLRHYCLSRNVAAALPPAWPAEIARTPDEAAMLALLDQPDRNI